MQQQAQAEQHMAEYKLSSLAGSPSHVHCQARWPWLAALALPEVPLLQSGWQARCR